MEEVSIILTVYVYTSYLEGNRQVGILLRIP